MANNGARLVPCLRQFRCEAQGMNSNKQAAAHCEALTWLSAATDNRSVPSTAIATAANGS